MILPELALQIVYARVAWGLVLAALLVALWRRRASVSPLRVAAVALVCMVLMGLPGTASPAHWLGLAFQAPSVMLAALCALSLHKADVLTPEVRLRGALVLLLIGALLYVDVVGWTAFEWYALGAEPRVAPLAVLLLGALALWLVRHPASSAAAWALLAAVVVYSTLRLPTGNLWDALLDPLLWLACVGQVPVALWRRLRRPPGHGARPAA